MSQVPPAGPGGRGSHQVSAGRHREGGGGGTGSVGGRNAQPCHTQALGASPGRALRSPIQRSAETTPPGPPDSAARGMDPAPGQVKHPRRGAPAPGGQSLIQSHSAQVPIGQRTAMKTYSNCSVSSLLILTAGSVQGPALLSPRPFHGIISHLQILPGHQSTCQSLLLTSVPELPTCWAHCIQQVLALVLSTDIKNLKREGQ